MKHLIQYFPGRTLAALTLILFSGTARTTAAEKRLALVMGVWQYDAPGLANLPGIEADVKRFADRVKQLGFTVTTVTNPNITAAKEAIDRFGDQLRDPETVGLFYFSGHGGEFEGTNFLIPAKANLHSARDLESEAVSSKRLLKRMEESGAAVNLVFLDCCRSTISNAKAADSGLASMQASGVFIGFATASEKEANASQDGSIYTNALLKYMGQPGLSITDMHTQVTGEVERITGELGVKQTPFQYSGLNRVYYLTPQGGVQPPPPPPLPPPPAVEDDPVPQKPVGGGSPFLFPDSSERVISRQELAGLDANTLWIARNEIYARHGYIFASERGRSLTRRLGSLYQPRTADQNAVSASFNQTEQANVETIQALESARGGGGNGGGGTYRPPVQDYRPAGSPWLIPDSSVRRLTRADLNGLSRGQLWRARNEIYARHGYIFAKEEGKALARSLGAAYVPRTSNADAVEASFNAVEKANVTLIKSLE